MGEISNVASHIPSFFKGGLGRIFGDGSQLMKIPPNLPLGKGGIQFIFPPFLKEG